MAEFENERYILAEIRGIMENVNDIMENTQELLGAIFIQEQRNYDMLSIIADKLGADAKRLSFMHEQGKVLAPAPSFIAEDEQNEA